MKKRLALVAVVAPLALSACSGDISFSKTGGEKETESAETTAAAGEEESEGTDETKELSGDRLEELIAEDAERQGLAVDSIDCPDSISAEVGDEVECSLTDADGRDWDVVAVSKGLNADGSTVNFRWDATPSGEAAPSDGDAGDPITATGTITTNLDGSASAQSLAVFISTYLGKEADVLVTGTCEGPLEGKVGASTDCTFEGNGRTFDAHVTTQAFDDANNKLTFKAEITF